MSVRDHLRGLYEQHQKLTPQLVVAEATPEDHPLHEYFEWDNEVAGPAYREHQARQLIRSVRIQYVDDEVSERSVRAFVSVPDHEEREDRSYRSVEDVVGDPFLRQLALRDMERDWKAMKRRYASFAEFADMIREDLAS